MPGTISARDAAPLERAQQHRQAGEIGERVAEHAQREVRAVERSTNPSITSLEPRRNSP